MTIPIIVILISLAILVWSADYFVDGAAAVASKLGVSPFVIGLTIIAFGTSAPEIFVSIFAAIDGATPLAMGNAVGSNIANLSLVLGATALLRPVATQSNVVKTEIPLLLIVTLVASFLLYDKLLTRVDGSLLLAGQVALLIWLATRGGDPEAEDAIDSSLASNKAWFMLIIGLLALLASSKGLVWAATDIATQLGVSELVIGLTIVAIGTSLPELAAAIAAATKGHSEMAIGNVVGSNLFNTLTVLGIAGVLGPDTAPDALINRDLLVLIVLTIIILPMAANLRNWKSAGRVGRLEGSFLLAAFFAYQTWIYLSA